MDNAGGMYQLDGCRNGRDMVDVFAAHSRIAEKDQTRTNTLPARFKDVMAGIAQGCHGAVHRTGHEVFNMLHCLGHIHADFTLI
jgi:hypothetical protein